MLTNNLCPFIGIKFIDLFIIGIFFAFLSLRLPNFVHQSLKFTEYKICVKKSRQQRTKLFLAGVVQAELSHHNFFEERHH